MDKEEFVGHQAAMAASMLPLRILVEPLGAGQWRASTAHGRVLVERTRQPLFAGARALISEGCDPGTMAVMAHANRPALDCFLPRRLAVLARLTVEEGERSARIRLWSDPAERRDPWGAGAALQPVPASDDQSTTPGPLAVLAGHSEGGGDGS